MKAYADIEQSKKLASILPLESADMFYNEEPDETYPKDIVDTKYPMVIRGEQKHFLEEYGIPCWSLVALLNILPHCIDDRYDLVLGKLSDNKGWYVMYDDVDHFTKFYVTHSNLIDACVEMIIRLEEDNLL